MLLKRQVRWEKDVKGKKLAVVFALVERDMHAATYARL